jgi:pimeloyl-ACP methyl ester carboxylesterase
MGIDMVDPGLLGRSLFSPGLDAETRARYTSRFQPESSRVALEMGWPAPVRPITPSLVIGGDRDLLIPVDELKRTAAAFRSELQVVAGANHLLMLDTCWQDVAERVLAWVDAGLQGRRVA